MKKKYNKTYFTDLDIDFLNQDLPIKLNKIEPIIKTISEKYPTLNKSSISLIVKTMMEQVREELLNGNTININNFLISTRLYTFCRLRKNKITFNSRIQTATPTFLKKS